MVSIVVLLVFFVLLAMMILGNKNLGYSWVFLSLVFFPSCIYFTQSPQISPQQIFLYGFLALAAIKNGHALFEGVFKNPLFAPLSLVLFSLMTTLVMNGGGGKEFYNAFRFYFENYAYWIVAFMGGLCYKENRIEEKWFYPIMAIFVFGIIELVLQTNYIFPLICKAFPVYDGYYDLGSAVSAARSYRNRIFVTTTHPTVFGCMLSCAFMLFTCRFKKISWSRNKVWFAWVAMLVLICCSGSRTAIACTLFSLFLWGLSKVSLKLKFLAVVVAVFLAANFTQKAIDEFSVEGQGSSLSMRQEQLLFSYVHFMNSPIYGNGIRYTSKTVMERDTYNDRVVDSEIGGLESVIFILLIDYGLLGFVAYFLQFIFAFAYFFKRRRFEYAQAGMLMTILFVMFACMSGEIGGNNTFAYMLIGYCLGACRVEEEDEKEEETKMIAAEETEE